MFGDCSARMTGGRAGRAVAAACCAILVLTFWGCTSGGVRYQPPSAGAAGLSQTPVPMTTDYRLAPGDEIQVDVLWHPELSSIQMVRPDGRVTAVGVGDVSAAGRTVAELDSSITAVLSTQLANPEVSVLVRHFSDLVIYALGEVKFPGQIKYLAGMHFLDVVGSTGGLTRDGQFHTVLLVKRRGPDGTPVAYRLNVNRAISSGGREDNPPLDPYDIVYVPRSVVAQAAIKMQQIFAAAAAPMDLYIKGWDVSRKGEGATTTVPIITSSPQSGDK
jgi:protein involved in polysaccharide export with SLBB domain